MPNMRRLERKAFKAYEENYLRNSVSKTRRLHELRQEFALRQAEQQGFVRAGVQMTELVDFLESIGASDVSEETAMPMVIRVVTGYRERNDLLEQARLEGDETIEGLEQDLEKSRDSERKLSKQAVKWKSELAILKENHANAIRTGARSITSGSGAGTHTDSIRTVRVAGVDQALR